MSRNYSDLDYIPSGPRDPSLNPTQTHLSPLCRGWLLALIPFEESWGTLRICSAVFKITNSHLTHLQTFGNLPCLFAHLRNSYTIEQLSVFLNYMIFILLRSCILSELWASPQAVIMKWALSIWNPSWSWCSNAEDHYNSSVAPSDILSLPIRNGTEVCSSITTPHSKLWLSYHIKNLWAIRHTLQTHCPK